MDTSNILLFDLGSVPARTETLRTQLHTSSDPPITVHLRQFNGSNMYQAGECLAAALAESEPDLIILILSQEAQSAAPILFRTLLRHHRSPPVVTVPHTESTESIHELFQLGASDYLLPPFRAADVLPRLQRLLTYRRTQSTPSAALKEELGLEEFVGESPALLDQIKKIPRLARCDASVLVTGETGTGKEICARSVHYLSPRAKEPFVPLNCGTVPVDLLENELFGHAPGAYTSALTSHNGIIQVADGGSLFLDEIDSLPLAAQVKLLRFLQDKQFRPLGSSKVSTADVRVIAASNINLKELTQTGRFRLDLLYRLNVLPLHLPPLRLRAEDIPLLARHFLRKYAAEYHCPATDLAPTALHKLTLYDWPGNVRELENVIERATILSTGNLIQSHEIDLPVPDEPAPTVESFNQLKAKVIADFERTYIRNLLDQHHGNIAHAARAAQKDRRVFFELMRKHQITVGHPPHLPKAG